MDDPDLESGSDSSQGADIDDTLPSGFSVGEYHIVSRLAQGGMGTVYAAQQPEIGARVAVKVLASHLSRDPRLVQRFIDEARAVNKIRHPNIIDIFSFGRLSNGRHYFVMEYLEGETLAARLARGPLPPSEARRLLRQICEALEAAHQEHIVHRDLKPENLSIVTPRHGQPFAKILDFGIAKLMGEISAAATEPGVAMGTPHFMAPEQCRGEALVDHRADIYAMGVILYRNWAGRLPFEGETFMSVVSQQITATPTPPSAYAQVPARLERLILACLEKDPARRPQSARALAVELDAALADAIPGETLPSVPLPQPLPPPTRLRRRWFWVVAALATAFAGLAALFLGTGHRHAEILTMPTTSSPLPVPLVEQAAPKEPLPPSAAARPDKGVPRFSAPPRHSSRPVEVKASPSSPLDTKGFLTDNPFR